MNYEFILFDCDGVIFNSNDIKSNAFYNVANKYSPESANELVDYNKKNGGISRFKKFEHYVEEILPKYKIIDVDYMNLAKSFGNEVKKSLLECEISPYLKSLKTHYPSSKWGVISGGDQSELRYIFSKREISHLFNLGIWGSPDNKYKIIEKNLTDILDMQVLYLGDSILDFEVATYFNFDFIFVSDWTEVTAWKSFVKDNSVNTIKNIGDLIS